MFHDAAITVTDDADIVFAGHSERYSKQKNDPFINHDIVNEALSFGKPDVIVLHEKNWAKKLRNVLNGNYRGLTEMSQERFIKKFYPELKDIPIKSYWHHETHAAAGVLTSDFDECAVMVIDAVGELDTASIWRWYKGKLTKEHSIAFPSSLGLFYSAVTQRVGLKPMEDEYILMGMAAYGKKEPSSELSRSMSSKYFLAPSNRVMGSSSIRMKVNLQKGLPETDFVHADDFDLARAAQDQITRRIGAYANYARLLTESDNLVYMGGVALNCVANNQLFNFFKNVHIMPNPGDAGSSLGGAALQLYNSTGKKVNWKGPYLGTNIEGSYPVQKALRSLENNDIFGIANGRAEFGPRALGNRSLLADPRGGDIKDKVNSIKKRQEFRPFAPVIMEEHVHDYFDMPEKTISPYMQFTARCKSIDFPAILHRDGTSRVQTVNKEQHPGLYELLSAFYERTGCPMLLNTSLNIKGQPIVNDEKDAQAFSEMYNVEVHTHDE